MEIKIKLNSPVYGEFHFEFSCSEKETAQLINDPVYHKVMDTLLEEFKKEQFRKCVDSLQKSAKPWPKKHL